MKNEKLKKRAKAQLVRALTLAAAGLLMVILANFVLKDWLIIAYGIRTFAGIRFVTLVVFGVGVIYSLIALIPLIRVIRITQSKQAEQQRLAQGRSKVLADYAQDSDNPELTRKRLEQLAQDLPECEEIVDKCLSQMDKMDRLQAQQADLLEANDARYLRDTVQVVNNVERRLCRNFRNIVNLCIAADLSADTNQEHISNYLRDNKSKLSDTKELLRASVEWINQYNSNEDSDRSELESWIEVIRASLREEK